MPREKSGPRTPGPDTEAALAPAQIISALRAYEVDISQPVAVRIADYVRLLLRWNQKVSLTTVTMPQEILTRHFGESFFGARVAGIQSGRLLDIGSGAGFPALPIAMLSPAIRETLLEPNVKKAAFLAEVSRHVGLVGRVDVVRARLEEFPAPETPFDFVTSRAVRVSSKFLEKCAEMLTDSGRIVLWLGQEDVSSARDNPDWIWAEPALIPGSERRFILRGSPAKRCST